MIQAEDPARIVEALLFASADPLSEESIAQYLPGGSDVRGILLSLQANYAPRGFQIVEIERTWAFRTAPDLSSALRLQVMETRKLSRAAVETLAIIAYHQPVTRAEIEAVRGVSVAKGTLDVLVEAGWVRLRGRRRSPGRPVTFGTTPAFLDHFGLSAISDLPGLEELKASGFFDGRLPSAFDMPLPTDDPALQDNEDPVEADMLDFFDDNERKADI